MINELHQLNMVLQESEITPEAWHKDYGEIANITPRAPCLRIVIDGQRVAEIENVPKNKHSNIRKFGNKQGAFPAMNLSALYRVTDENTKEKIDRLIKDGGDFELDQIKSWCEVDNWTPTFCNKYKINFESRPNDILDLLGEENEFAPLTGLVEAAKLFKDPKKLHKALFDTSMKMLSAHRDIATALRVLFFLPTPKEINDGGSGTLSVVLDTYELEEAGLSTAGPKFAKSLNRMLLQAEQAKRKDAPAEHRDAFGRSFVPLEEPMPIVKLAAGFDVPLRTMFKGQPCQHRYGRIENATYPISGEERTELSAALKWLSAEERKNKTWVSIGKGEAMFVFPSRMSADIPELASLYQLSFDHQQNESLFEAKAKDFSDYVTVTKELDPEHYPERIQFFVLRKLDKARNKIVYSYNAKTEDIVLYSIEWQAAAKNLPEFHFGMPRIPFPLNISQIMNSVWKRDGTLATNKFKAVDTYYGMELFFCEADLDNTLRILLNNSTPLAAYAGKKLNSHQSLDKKKQLLPLKNTLALMGMLLYWKGIRKDEYMNDYPYLFGQLLKAADGLHELYCMTERNGQVPPQLIGSSMYQAAMDAPMQTLAQLAKRLSPYLGWAKTHPEKYFTISEKENGDKNNSPKASYYLYILSELASKLSSVLTDQTRFNDSEKAALFIGFLASFPKKDKDRTVTMKGELSNE